VKKRVPKHLSEGKRYRRENKDNPPPLREQVPALTKIIKPMAKKNDGRFRGHSERYPTKGEKP